MARKRRAKEPENHERWLVSYADFITLLFAFFTILYAISNKDLDKSKEFEASVKRSFAIMGFGGLPKSSNMKQGAGSQKLSHGIELFPKKGSGAQELSDYIRRHLERSLNRPLGASAGKQAGHKQQLGLTIQHDSVGVRIRLAASTLFAVGSTRIKPQAYATLEHVGNLLAQAPNKMIIEGHTDSQPIHSRLYPTNWELASARATKILRYLIDAHGISPSKLVALSYADQKPIATNQTIAGQTKNRRVEILLVTSNNVLH